MKRYQGVDQPSYQSVGDHHGVALCPQLVERGHHACVPVVPGGCDQVRFAAAVARELAAVHQESATCEPLGDELEFNRRAAKTVDQ